MTKKITPIKLSPDNDDFIIIVEPTDFDPKSQQVLVTLDNKVATGVYDPITRNITAKITSPISRTYYSTQSKFLINDIRVKVQIKNLWTDKIISTTLQEFLYDQQQSKFKAIDEIKSTSNVRVRDVTNNNLSDAGYAYKITELDYVCVSKVYKHEVGVTYFNLDNVKIVLKSNYRPYAFVGITEGHIGQLAIIENIETGQLFYPLSTDEKKTIDKKGYKAYDAYGKLRIKFDGFSYSNNEGTKVYANTDCEYFVNGKSIGKFSGCRSCSGLLRASTSKEKQLFTINEKTFKLPLPNDLSVIASDINEIKVGMPILIDNDRTIVREDKEDQRVHTNLVPSNENAEKIFKEVATLWNNYENDLYKDHFKPLSNDLSDEFDKELLKLDKKKLLMPELIKNGVLSNVSEKFIKDFFLNKIKGYFNTIEDLQSLYFSEKRTLYEQAGEDLVNNFFEKKGKEYYKTKVIADAIYQTEGGKIVIDNMIKLIDQVFQYKLTKPIIKENNSDFLEDKLDYFWFKDKINVETFPSFGVDSLNIITRPDEERLSLFCIGGTQTAKVAVKKFTPIDNKGEIGYDAVVILQYGDKFGVSESDFTKDLKYAEFTNLTEYNYRAGVMAQWVLQHQYGYKPFDDFLTYTIKMKRVWKK